ncbi:hypothetical protein NEF87_001040 [Candidatus Lokiarchaeum ossiferum]|uniref:Caspase family protein n=1 Tax=Candidatus Lokiarchaeum ossiferum TaxID=2951803 RepID=A0ABY6HMM0_9ARCH|nr:hypothetical protein NEF87_001040 [Candidatus Lokiarchaeum sp. B-35]
MKKSKRVVFLAFMILMFGGSVISNAISKASAASSSSDRNVALIVQGNSDKRFLRDTFEMSKTLREEYGFSNIYSIGPSTPGFSVAKILTMINTIANTRSYDQVVIFWAGHGNIDRFAVNTEVLYANQLDNALDAISCEKMIIFLGPCHSGSFIDNLNDNQNRAIYTSCAYNQIAFSYYSHSLWTWGIYSGLDFDLDGHDVDTNNNGLISLKELHDYSDDFIREKYVDYVFDPNADDDLLKIVDPMSIPQTPQRWVGSSFGSDSNFYLGTSGQVIDPR